MGKETEGSIICLYKWLNIFDVTLAGWSQPFPTHQKKLQTPSLNC